MVPVSYNVRSLFVRKITTLATAGGIALVVFVLAAALMLREGVNRAIATSGRSDTVIVLRQGSDAELSSGINQDLLGVLKERPEVAGGDQGILPEVVVVITGKKADGTGETNIVVRGTGAHVMQFRPETRIVAGRAPQAGTNEVIVGRAIANRFVGLSLDKSFDLRRNRPLKVVGIFSANGSSYESEVWGDLDTIRQSLGRSGAVSSARVRLASAAKYSSYRTGLESDKRLGVKVQREADYYEQQSEGTSAFLFGLGFIMAVLFSIGAMIGAAITMNGAIANRTREIGTLRALGFSRFSILISFLLEAIFLSLIGGAIGIAFAMLLSLTSFPVMNFQTFSEIVIAFRPTPGVILSALIFAGVMGLLGGLLPAIRAARVSPVEAMRG